MPAVFEVCHCRWVMIIARHASGWIAATCAIVMSACARGTIPQRAPFVRISDLERIYGKLITAGNHPTADQNGTGDRVGLFLETNGTVWGLPLTASPAGDVLGCAPPGLHDARVTDTYPAGTAIIGATNEPTGWRGGTGKLEILLRDPRGGIRWRAVASAQMPGPVCRAQESPGPPQELQYYRLAPATGVN